MLSIIYSSDNVGKKKTGINWNRWVTTKQKFLKCTGEIYNLQHPKTDLYYLNNPRKVSEKSTIFLYTVDFLNVTVNDVLHHILWEYEHLSPDV